MSDGKVIKVMKNGPYLVYGDIPLFFEYLKKDALGRADRWEKGERIYPDTEVYALCRCGNSTNPPFCTCKHDNFDGTETASKGPYSERCKEYPGGSGIMLLQDPKLCTGAGFCHSRNNVMRTIKKDRTVDIAREQVSNCPGGSLVLKVNGEELEPDLKKEILVSFVSGRMGSIKVRGGIPVISENGEEYEVRNRVALCQCGKSNNKPFCDASHQN